MNLKPLFGLGVVAAIASLGLVAPPSAVHAANVPSVRKQPPPRRLTHWPRLQSWLAGSRIDWKPKAGEPRGMTTELASRGKELYGLYCVQCHGASGRGDGPRAPVFHPPPRDLTSGVFKYRSTPAGQPPTRADLFRTISNGLRGTGMAAFGDLPERDRWALVEYVRTLSPVFAKPTTPLPRPAAPADLSSPGRVARGHAAFGKLGCTACHGENGAGDGPAAAALARQGFAPRDFHTTPLRTGNDPEMVYRTLLTGLEGTPMLAYSVKSTDQRWDLVAYLLSLESHEKSGRNTAMQQGQARHAVVDGCGCQARR